MISISTSGKLTARIFLKMGVNFKTIIKNKEKNLVFVACKFGHIDALEFLRDEVGMDLISFKADDGESSLYYVLKRANFKMTWFMLEYYIQNQAFDIHVSELQKFMGILISCSSLYLNFSEKQV